MKVVVIHRKGVPVNLNTVLGILANDIFIQRFNGNLYFWNRSNARILLIVSEVGAEKSASDLTAVGESSGCTDLDSIFNDLLGIGPANARCTELAFQAFADLWARTIGLSSGPVGFLSLNGLVVLARQLPPSIRIPSSPWGPNALFQITNLSVLLHAIASSSAVLAASNSVGPLLGDESLLATLPDAIIALLANLDSAETSQLTLDYVAANAIGAPLTIALDLLFKLPGDTY